MVPDLQIGGVGGMEPTQRLGSMPMVRNIIVIIGRNTHDWELGERVKRIISALMHRQVSWSSHLNPSIRCHAISRSLF